MACAAGVQIGRLLVQAVHQTSKGITRRLTCCCALTGPQQPLMPYATLPHTPRQLLLLLGCCCLRYKPEIDVWFAGPKMPVPTGSFSWYLRGMDYNNALVVMASYRVPVDSQRAPYEQQQPEEVVSSKVGAVLGVWGRQRQVEVQRGGRCRGLLGCWCGLLQPPVWRTGAMSVCSHCCTGRASAVLQQQHLT